MAAAFTNAGFDAVAVPEIPTIVRSAGFLYPAAGPHELLLRFERTIFNLQLDIENSFTSLATARQRHSGTASGLAPRPCVLLLDRALPDIKAYCPPDIWSTLLGEGRGSGSAAASAKPPSLRHGGASIDPDETDTVPAPPTDDAAVLARYDMVVHLVTAADGAQEYYTLANNAARTEDIACECSVQQQWSIGCERSTPSIAAH